MTDSSTNRYPLLAFIALVLAYVITGKLGLMLALSSGYASVVFPPAGIALAAAYLTGRKAWPWIFLGALLLHIWIAYTAHLQLSASSWVTAFAIAFASMLQAAIGGWGLTRAIGSQSRFDQIGDVLPLLFIIPLVCLISSTLSVSTLVAMNIIDNHGFVKSWMAWWTGDTLGALVLFPVCLVFAARPYSVWRKRRLAVALPMLFALILAILSFITGSKWEKDNALTEFRAMSDQIKQQIIRRLDEQAMLLLETRAFFLHENNQISRKEFGRYMLHMQDALEHFDSIQAIEWAPRIEDSQRSVFEAGQRRELPDFIIRERNASGQLIPAQRRTIYYPVTYIEPIAGNQPALGLDLAFSPERQAALALALSQRKLVSTAPIHLVQDKAGQAGILLIYPLTGEGGSSGVLLTVLKMSDFIEKLFPENRSLLFVRLVDVEAHKNVYDNFRSDSTPPLITETITFGERQYRLERAPTPAYWIQHQGLQSYGILVVGLFGIGVLGSLLLLGTGYTARVETQVQERTRELQQSEQRFHNMADSAPVLIWLADPGKMCCWFNQVWLDFSGRTMEQEIGNGWTEGVHPDDFQCCLDTYVDHFDRRQPFTMEYRLKRHDGEYRWLTDNGIPRYNHEGRFEGYIGSCIDITEIKAAQDYLQASHNLLKKLSHHLPGVIYQFKLFPDGQACFPYCSEGIQEIYEVTPAEVSKNAEPVFARLHPDDLDKFSASIQDSANTLQPWNLEYRVRLPRKGERWLSGQSNPEKMADGSLLWHGFITDITERKQAEDQIQAANHQYQQLLDAATEVSIIATDKDGVIRLFNRGAERMLGYAAEDVVGKMSPAPFHLAEEIDQRAQELSDELGYSVQGFEVFTAKAKIEGQDRREWTYVRKDGVHLVVTLVLTAVHFANSEDNGYLGIALDITQLKLMGQELHASEAMKIAILESSLDAIITIDMKGVICEFNQPASHIFGYTLEDVKGKSMAELLMPERYREAHRQSLKRYLNSGESSVLGRRVEFTALRRTGEEFPVELAITPIRHGEQTFFTAFLRDISESKLAEESLRRGREQAEHASLVKSQFLAMMSHEIRTPLNAILGTQELLADTSLDATQKNYLELARDAGTNLMTLINDILDLTKVEAGKLELENIGFDALRVVNEVVELVGVKAREKNLVLTSIVAPEVSPWVTGDPWRLRQVLLNLLTNAIKFTPSGMIAVKLSPRSGESNDGILLFEVIDTGIGIDEEVQSRLFELFIQADPSDTRKYGGSGLGLAISRRLVELWGGHLGLESRPGIGSRFWFSFGSAADAAQITLAHDEAAGQVFAKPSTAARILLVEDTLTNQFVLSAILRSGGYEVDVADSGGAAIAAVQANHYDLIFMDISMPDMNGMDATRSIRQLGGAAASVPIIAMTAHAVKGYKEMCMTAGMNGYATKPIGKKDLLALVEQWCGSGSKYPTA